MAKPTSESLNVRAPDDDIAWIDANEQAFHHAPTGMAVLNLDGVFVRVNPALCHLLGADSEQILGQSILDFARTDHVEPFRDWLIGAQQDKPGVIRGTAWWRRPDNTSRWLAVEADVVTANDGSSRYLLMMVHDQTGTKTMEEALRRTNEELNALVSSAPVAIYQVDPEGRVLIWNHSAEELFGWTAAEAIGKMLPIVSPDKLDEYAAFRAQILAGHPLEGTEVTRKHRDGHPIDLALWTAAVHDSRGVASAIMAVAVDITDRRRADEALRASEHRFRTMVQNISDTVSLVAADGRIMATTGQTKDVLGYPSDWWIDRTVFELAHPDDLPRAHRLFEETLQLPGVERTTEIRARHADGRWEYLELTGVNLLDDPDVGGIVVTTRNITVARLSQFLQTSSTRILELIARSAPVEETFTAVIQMVEEHAEDTNAAVLLADDGHLVPRGTHRLAPAMLRQLWGVPAEDWGPVISRFGYANSWSAPVRSRAGGSELGVITAFSPSDRGASQQERQVLEAAAQLVSIAVERAETEARLAHQVLHDGLTGLPNRTLLIDRLAHALTRSEQSGDQVAVLFVDIDRFKVVNDSLGHGAGDQLLLGLTSRLQSIVRPDDTIARFGGDEFVVLCEHDGPRTMLTIAARLEQAMAEPLVLDDGSEVFLTVSMGLAVGDEMRPDALLRNADAAMYRAKERGRNRLEVFDEGMREAAVHRLNLENDLRRALERNEFVVHFQPVMSVANGQVVGAESLVRWAHPTRGMLGPDEFIPVAEETGMVIALDEWVLSHSLEQARNWRDEHGVTDFTLSVNLSARQLTTPDLTSRVGRALETHDWPAGQLCLELTESVLMDDLELAEQGLVALKSLGVQLAIDDFGTGYSSLTYLQRFPVDIVKIDRSFVAGLGVAGRNLADDRGTIATAVVGMAHALGLVAVAEGVEHSHELAVLHALRCDLAQGFLFATALPADEFLAFLRGNLT